MGIDRTNAKIVAMGVSAMVLSGGVGAYAQATVANADKVDGKHAVSATATNAQAAGKLVAMSSVGRLPAKFVAKVGDADKLDGKDSSVFQRRCAPGSVIARTMVDYLATSADWSSAPAVEDQTYVCNGVAILVKRTSLGHYDLSFGGLGTSNLPVMLLTPTKPGTSATATVPVPCPDLTTEGRLCWSVTLYNGNALTDSSFAAVLQ